MNKGGLSNLEGNLQHVGIKGMRWGVRNQQTKPTNNSIPNKTKYDEWDKAWDKHDYGRKGQQRIEKRIESGQSKSVARGKEYVRSRITMLGTTAIMLDIMSGGEIHRAAGRDFVRMYKKSKVAKAAVKTVVKIAQDKKFDPIDVAFKVLD